MSTAFHQAISKLLQCFEPLEQELTKFSSLSTDSFKTKTQTKEGETPQHLISLKPAKLKFQGSKLTLKVPGERLHELTFKIRAITEKLLGVNFKDKLSTVSQTKRNASPKLEVMTPRTEIHETVSDPNEDYRDLHTSDKTPKYRSAMKAGEYQGGQKSNDVDSVSSS